MEIAEVKFPQLDLRLGCVWLPHLSLLMLGNEVAVEVLQGHFGHGDPLLSVVTHGGARALAGHRHALAENTQREVRTLDNTQLSVHTSGNPCPLRLVSKKHTTRKQPGGIIKACRNQSAKYIMHRVVIPTSDITVLS